MLLGAAFPLFDRRLEGFGPRIRISPSAFHGTVWATFAILVIVTVTTAPSIPLISAFEGASAEALSQERGEFLKGREGAGLVLLYLATFLVSTFVPYSIVLLYGTGARLRHVVAAVFSCSASASCRRLCFLTSYYHFSHI